MPEMTLTPKSVRIAEDEAKWLSAAATKGGVTQNDLVRLALNRLRQGARCGQPDQARDRPRHRQGLQVQAHTSARGSRQGALGLQGADTRVQGRKRDGDESCAAHSSQACSHRLSASSQPCCNDRRRRCARVSQGASIA
jgi:hypothetical protein